MQKENPDSKMVALPNGTEVHYSGPPVEEGPLPALFYFTLSAHESIHSAPINEPTRTLSTSNLRVFSLTLPSHGTGLKSGEAMEAWAKEFEQGHNFVAEFVDQATDCLHQLIRSDIIIPSCIALSGLSRGGFMATHLAAEFPEICAILAFAPLTQLSYSQYFKHIAHEPIPQSLNLENLIDKLSKVRVRFYIGNRDTSVGTEPCFRFIQQLTEAKYKSGERSPNVELIISPSVGHKGHGTLPHTFRDGAKWVGNILTKNEDL